MENKTWGSLLSVTHCFLAACSALPAAKGTGGAEEVSDATVTMVTAVVTMVTVLFPRWFPVVVQRWA